MKLSFLTQFVAAAFALNVMTYPAFAEVAKNSEKTTASQPQSQLGFELIKQSINKSPNDKAIYQGIKLDNGMEVLLISDSQANKSLMSAIIPIGSMDDPISQQGLAHYLEHMILMGSKNYPETNSLDGFLTKNGGMNNASTASHRTAYYLQVNNEAFSEAVTRLADTLAFPLLLETNAKKEVNAVNAEMVRAKSHDGHLLHSVNLATANPAHPATKFAVGNKETLSDKPDSKLQTELEQFYKQHYSANLFKVVLYSNQSIEQMAKLAANTLGKMENKHFSIPQTAEPRYRDEDKSVFIQYKPVKSNKMLVIGFDFPNDEMQFKHKTGKYIAYMLNNNTDGTLSDYLIKQGLSDGGIEAVSSANIGRDRGSFDIYIELTDKGLSEQDQIISLVFQQIEKIKQEGIQESYFSEVKESLKQDFQHLQVEKNMDFVEFIADQMLHFPLEHVIDQPYLTETMDNEAIKAKLAAMNIDNARIMLVSDTAKTDKKTPYFEAGYSVAKITQEQKQKWLDFSKNPQLNLPELNPYFTTDFTLNKVETGLTKPKLINDQAGNLIYTMPSVYFTNEPKAKIGVGFNIRPRKDDLKSLTAASILGYMNNLAQTKLDFQSSVAGMNLSLAPAANGLALSAEGYTQNLAKLMLDSVKQFSRFEFNEDVLAQAKQRLHQELDRNEKENSLNQANAALSRFASYPYFDVPKQREMIDSITLADIEQLRQRILQQSSGFKLLSVGNLSAEQVSALAEDLQAVIKNQKSANATGQYVDVSTSQRKINVIKSVPNEDNALLMAFMPNGYNELESLTRAKLLRSIISRWYFDDLRTDKQLGYVVYATDNIIGKTAGIQFMVQSPNTTPAGILEHNERFFTQSFERLKNLSDEEFGKYRDSLVEKLQYKPESLAEEFSEFGSDFSRNNPKFDRLQQVIELTKALTKADIVAFYQKAVIEKQGFVFVSQAVGTKTKAEDVAKFDGFEQIESIEKLQREFEIKDY
ncbi:TPA: pitrilysin [Mannheimia haemolytica]|uniref:Protease 3 n=3 Tax=Mannheimia haemolytica TaxID=75985 RepID=A0A249A431_MANHA|nr:pitrilysin [Mannheimia haemolytica]AWW72448.1 pitrilysin [Pasteurellaceae bacterium 12565]AGI33767.1 pitrilysin [Mannheimia haemolytica USDA-ARS-USMARC-183]AGK01321.1 protease III PtrA [Mannheimia haemolytica M42548]AGQ26152.1 protease [Mannheimia haemolytica D153]AGQ39114.1 protease [Mannheimia haemolytica D171]